MFDQLALLNEYADSSNVGVLLSSVLFGVFIVQVYNYASGAVTDKLGMQLLVAWVAACETTHTLLLWVYYIPNLRASRFDALALLNMSSPLAFTYWFSGVMGMTVQSFYGYRIYRLSGNFYLAFLSWAGSLVRIAFASVAVVLSYRTSNIMDFMTRYGWSLLAVFITSVAVDLINCSLLCAILLARRSDQESTKRIVDKLIVWTLETGMITTALAVMMLVVILIHRYSFIPGVVHVYPNMFSLSFMISLNARNDMRSSLYKHRRTQSSASKSSAPVALQATRSKLPQSLPIALQKSMPRVTTEIKVYSETYEDVVDIGQSPRRLESIVDNRRGQPRPQKSHSRSSSGTGTFFV